MLTINNLCVSFGQLDVLKNLCMQIGNGEVRGIVGLNGSGKTTLFNTLYGNVKKQSGEILFDDEKLGRSKITFFETNSFFYSSITGKEYLSLFKTKNPNFDIKGWNEIFDLPLNKLIETYSTGMKKKLALMGILSMENPIYLLDEPFNGLDLETNQKVKQIVEILKEKGCTILVSSHILETLTGTCDSISYLNNGIIEFTALKNEFGSLAERVFKDIDDSDLRRLMG
ncbi:MAG: hypothetical protein A2W91_14510 [Bacteroidetes bacterium GWF2_38_335]|nr:MAG: hypothetical protein A2W91_14510 [Bacteroidetes bacterium GWF2_38_335]OFY79328.1 MAG: hypothetical protein A2281_16645 [Bacteroidetes bacterium RIFOXYA12_FULL_38_20]HBS85587.1 hypothetical protein [Bacteroidales bacterium]